MWKRISGALLLLWQPIEWVLSKLEHLEFVTNERHVKVAMSFLTNLPPLVNWALPAIGLTIIVWDVWQSRQRTLKAREPTPPEAVSLSREPNPVAMATGQAIKQYQRELGIEPAKPIPDFRIRDLFFYIRPDVLDGKNLWEHVGLEIMDKLATGQLKAWGRRYFVRSVKKPLTEIDVKVWHSAAFTYDFFKDDSDDEEHVRFLGDKSSVHSYCDVRVNRAQAEAIAWSSVAVTTMTVEPQDADAEFEAGFNRALRDNDPVANKLYLVHLRSKGVILRNDLPTFLTSADLNKWVNEVNGKWLGEVIDTLKILSQADSKWFETLDTVPPARVPIPNIRLGGKEDRALFESVFRQHDYRLARLEALLKKHGVGA
jgi:hypothetical protein